jgi:uncharacterized protein (TIGR01319 family)
MAADEINRILATDCGSTTTKAILIEKRDGVYRLIVRGEAPTTVEKPFDDVTVGVLNAVTEVEELSNTKILKDGHVMMPGENGQGVDVYLSTSSAGGGLQMMVAGVVKAMSAESAERAALGAGAIIMDVIAVDDGRKDYEKVERIRQLRPDMILVSGGTDGGTIQHLVEIAEMIVAADPKPRLGIGMTLPVIFAGNRDAQEPVRDLLEQRVALTMTDNLRPTLERENLLPAREAIHELFLEHVMQQAPGYSKLSSWVSTGIMATPNAVGKIMVTIARQRNIDIIGVDIGGATTDTFSVFADPDDRTKQTYNRTVSANLGLSYSICNVLAETGVANIVRWIPFEIDEFEVRNRLRNKMIRPTTIPQTMADLLIEQAVAREALRLAFNHHKLLARGLKGIQQTRTIGDALSQEETGQTLVKMMNLDMIVGSGGVLSHAPKRHESALMMLDAYQPEGITMLAVDSIFMMPQLGVLSEILPEAATQVFEKDCLIKLGDCICPTGTSRSYDDEVLEIEIDEKTERLKYGQVKVYECGVDEKKKVRLKPMHGFDVGAGRNKEWETEVEGGVVGIMVDCRGRYPDERSRLLSKGLVPALPTEPAARIAKLREWLTAFSIPLPGA